MSERLNPRSPVRLGLSMGTFLVVALIACLALALIVPNGGLHQPWLQFFPAFTWTAQGIAVGLVEAFAYGFFGGLIFAPIYNFFNASGAR